MKVTEDIVQTQNAIARMGELISSGDRAPGIHVSDLVMCLRKSWARYNGVLPNTIGPKETSLFMVGRAIQDYLTDQRRSDGEVTLEVDGVHGTIDHIDDEGFPWEIKATYKSSSGDIQDDAHYFDQLATYCCMLLVTVGYLAVVYINGSYPWLRKKRGGEPQDERAQVKVYRVEFEQEELNKWWGELLARKEELEEAAMLTRIPLGRHYTWECKFCPLKDWICEGGAGDYHYRWD